MKDNDTKILEEVYENIIEEYDVVKEQKRKELLDNLDDTEFLQKLSVMPIDILSVLINKLKTEYEFKRDLTRSMKSVMKVLYKRETLYYKMRLMWAEKALKRKYHDGQ